MFSLSDIFDKYKKDHVKPKELIRPDSILPDPLPLTDGVSIWQAVQFVSRAAKDEKAVAVYAPLCDVAEQAYDVQAPSVPGLGRMIRAAVERALALFIADDQGLLRCALNEYPSTQEFLKYHAANTVIFSLEIASGLAYSKDRLFEVALAAFYHDIGLAAYKDLVMKTEKLKRDECEAVKHHSAEGLKLAHSIDASLSQNVQDTIMQEHERLDGSGYPLGLKDAQINEIPQIVGLASAYEAMTHARVYGATYTSMEAIRLIVDNKKSFDPRIKKALINRIGVFPIGTLVRLSTNEIGLVIKHNPRLPLRPVVQVMFDLRGVQMKEDKILDLSGNLMIYVDSCVERHKAEATGVKL